MLEKFATTLPTRLWIAPPTKMDAFDQLTEEGYYSIFGRVGALEPASRYLVVLYVWVTKHVLQKVLL